VLLLSVCACAAAPQAARSGNSFGQRGPGLAGGLVVGRSERRMVGAPALGPPALAAGGDWRSKLQNLSTAIVQVQLRRCS
jgi:hypothetical protein